MREIQGEQEQQLGKKRSVRAERLRESFMMKVGFKKKSEGKQKTTPLEEVRKSMSR